MTPSRRLLLLLACIAAGALVGVVGQQVTGGAAWFLAIPAAVAVGWLFVANPTNCEPPDQGRPKPRDTDAPR